MCNNTPLLIHRGARVLTHNNVRMLREKLKAKEHDASWVYRPMSGSSMLSQAEVYSGVFTPGLDGASLTFAADRESHGAFPEQFSDSQGKQQTQCCTLKGVGVFRSVVNVCQQSHVDHFSQSFKNNAFTTVIILQQPNQKALAIFFFQIVN